MVTPSSGSRQATLAGIEPSTRAAKNQISGKATTSSTNLSSPTITRRLTVRVVMALC